MLLVIAACTHRAQTASSAAVAVDRRLSFDRQVSPFPVLDSTGRAYALPFLGGFEHPRPQLLDIDGDGVTDLFIQEESGQLQLFQRDAAGWSLTADRFQGIDIGEWYRFVDLDGDGLSDLFAESPLSYIRYHRNVGTRATPRLVVAADTLRDVQGTAIYADRQNIAQFADVDCNGKLDLLLGRVDGTITRYEMEGLDSQRAPRFRLITERFQDIQIIGTLTPSMHGANTMAIFDIDADGDPDILWGDFFEPGLLWLRNQGTCAQPDFHGDRIAFPPHQPLETSGYNAPAFGDVNGDGRTDLVVGVLGGAFNPVKTSTANLYQIEQATPGAWTLTTPRLLDDIDLGTESIPAFGDIDGDGDLDLVVGTKIEPANPRSGGVYWFENVGSRTAPSFQLRGHLTVLPAFHDAPALGDLDGDGLPDLVLGQFQDAVAWYRNNGTRGAGTERFVLVDSAVVRLPRGSNGVPELYDIDGDRDLDLFLGDASGRIAFFKNDGSSRAPHFTLVSDDYLGARAGRRAVPRFVDLDRDGAAELVVGSEIGGRPAVFRRLMRDSALAVALPAYAAPVFADVSGDGTTDLFAGTEGGGIVYYRNQGVRPNPSK